PSHRACSLQSKVTRLGWMWMPPNPPSEVLTDDHLSSPLFAKRDDKWVWSARKTLMAKPSARSKTSREFKDFAAQKSTRGGLSETEVNELIVMPARRSSYDAVAIATPVANWPNAFRKSRAEK